MTTEHISFDRLSDLADGLLPPDDQAAVERHLAACASCRDSLARLRGLLERAAALPPVIEPPAKSWQAVRGRLGVRRLDGPRVSWPRLADSWVMRAAAAILLVAASSTLTVIALRARDASPGSSAPEVTTVRTVATPAALRAVDESYADVLDELEATLATQRRTLAPETVATLERTLRIIDEAIAEARSALAADPRNGALLDVLSANYEQKVQLLRRASELRART